MYRITRVLSVGPFASQERAELLRAAGVTHVLNVSHMANEITSLEHGFEQVAWVPMSDSQRLPPQVALLALDTLHEMVAAPDSHVYVHCVAGLVRSPTILWLYLIALGIPPHDAREWIQSRSTKANAGSAAMTTHQHVLMAQKHGLTNYFPHPRPEIVVPFDAPGEPRQS